MPAYDPRDPFNPQNDPPPGWPAGRPWPPPGTDREVPGTEEGPRDQVDTLDDGTIVLRDGTLLHPDGTQTLPDGTVTDPSGNPIPPGVGMGDDTGIGETPIADTGSAVRAASAITTQRARQRKLQAAQPPVMRDESLDLGGDADLGVPVEPLVPGLSPTPRPVKPGGGGGSPLRRLNVNLSPERATSALIPNRTTSLSPSAVDVQQNLAASGTAPAQQALLPRKRKGGVRLGQLAPRPFG